MLIGIVGKPNCGKSTMFKAITLSPINIGNYPFVTIEPNRGIGYVKVDCPESEFNVKCTPNNAPCIGGKRFVPFDIMAYEIFPSEKWLKADEKPSIPPVWPYPALS